MKTVSFSTQKMASPEKLNKYAKSGYKQLRCKKIKKFRQ